MIYKGSYYDIQVKLSEGREDNLPIAILTLCFLSNSEGGLVNR